MSQHTTDQEIMDTLYSPFWTQQYKELIAQLQQSQGPRSPAILYEMAAETGITDSSLILDVGCGWGIHTSGLASRLRCRVIGIDILEANLKKAHSIATHA